ncbi:hypothetical protein BJX68DRAFT_133940 [Aspergillus pseudodeflectus]|uniref:Uncharacterized protein n=1 Tax=Aspergillus pseudodeflectus TaxID=176178 RepID=A0ABR4JZ39_9EURO
MGHLPDIESSAEHDEPLQCRSWTNMIIWCAISYCCMLIIFIIVCCVQFGLVQSGLLPLFVHGSSPVLFYAFSQSHNHFLKPKDVEIIALVPFQEVQETEILDCYLQRNLASNKGFLDQVFFIPQTNHTESFEWLITTVEATPSYSISNRNLPTHERLDALYVWIDGAVYLEEHTIPTMVKTKLDHPDSLIVSANVVNQGPLEKLHSHPLITSSYHLADQGRHTQKVFRTLGSAAPQAQDKLFQKSNLFPTTNDDEFDTTPIGKSIYAEAGPALSDWRVKAQQHYSFLYHLKWGNLYPYKFPMWSNPVRPISTKFFCFMGYDAAGVESFIRANGLLDRTTKVPDEGGHQVRDNIIIDGKGVVAHYSSKQGLEGLEGTDVLQRYREYARENVCSRL